MPPMNTHLAAFGPAGLALRLILAGFFVCLGGCEQARFEPVASVAFPITRTVPEHSWTPVVWTEYLQDGPVGNNLPDFSRAGYAMGDSSLPEPSGPVYDVAAPPFNAIPDDAVDDTVAIQAAVDAAGAAGGGVVLLPRGRLLVHSTPDMPYLRITHNNVILRGRGSGPGGSTVYLGAPGPEEGVRRLGSVPSDQQARRHAAIAVMGNEAGRELAVFTRDVFRGHYEVPVLNSDLLRPGMMVVVRCQDDADDADDAGGAGGAQDAALAPPAPDAPDLPAQLTRPYRLVPEQTDTFGPVARRHSWITRIESVPDATTVRMAKPARFDQRVRHAPRIYAFQGLHGVGIEHLRIESAWPGGYRHHKPYEENGVTVRTAKEQDYLWNGIWISNAVDGWVRDVTFKDLTQGCILSHAAHITIQDVNFEGIDGHAGVTVGWSNDNLVTRAVFRSRLVHPVTVTMMASGNVFTECTARYEGDMSDGSPRPAIDFHGLFPYENLFDSMHGFNVIPGGDLSVMPHGGVRNVFWNVVAPGTPGGVREWEGDAFVQSWAYASTSSGTPATVFEHLPQAFYIGVRRETGRISVGDSFTDRSDQWMTVEGLNRPGLALPSLYQAQRTLRTAP